MRLFSSIVALNFPGNPSAIFRGIISIWIDAIERKTLGPISHIVIKIRKFFPSFANLNSTSAIMVIIGSIRIFATLFHIHPKSVKPGVSHSMGSRSNMMRFFPETSTRFNLSNNQFSRINNSFFTTLTSANPLHMIPSIVFRPFNNQKTIKDFSREVDKFHGSIIEHLIRNVKEVSHSPTF